MPPAPTGERLRHAVERKETAMDTTSIVRIVAGLLIVVVVGLLIQRRRTKVK
jgi:CHASE3 domain sensor protein